MGYLGRNLQCHLVVRGTGSVVGPSWRGIFFLGKVGVKIGLGGNFGYAVARDPVANILVELFTISTVYRVVNTFDILLKTSITAIILGC